MKFERHSPVDILKPFIRAFMIIESGGGAINRLLPDTSIIMAFRFKGTTYAGGGARTRLPACAVSGLTKSARLVEYSKETATLLVIFNEGGAPAFSDVPLHQLFGIHVSLDNLLHRQKLDAVAGQLSAATHHSKRISIVEQFLLSELHESRSDRLILHAVQQIRAANGNIRIKDLATTLAISQDAFEKRFDRSIGASPKQFARIVRLRYVINS